MATYQEMKNNAIYSALEQQYGPGEMRVLRDDGSTIEAQHDFGGLSFRITSNANAAQLPQVQLTKGFQSTNINFSTYLEELKEQGANQFTFADDDEFDANYDGMRSILAMIKAQIGQNGPWSTIFGQPEGTSAYAVVAYGGLVHQMVTPSDGSRMPTVTDTAGNRIAVSDYMRGKYTDNMELDLDDLIESLQ